MAKEKFLLPTISSKEASATTRKIYQGRLNKLVPYGFKTIQDIMENPIGVVEAVNTIIPGNEGCPEHIRHSKCRCLQCSGRETKRYFYTAIFYALADTTYTRSKNPLYDAFQLQKQNYNSH